MNIILLGYMASGKSIIGKSLVKIMSYNFIDLDEIIEAVEGKNINEIFEDYGELYFRKKEKEYLTSLLQKVENTIIALGGGTPCYYDTMDNLLDYKNITTVYLNVSIPVLVNRLKNEKNKRPLIANIDTDEFLTEFVAKHLFERASFYNKAEIKVNANGTVEDIIKKIVLQLF